MKAGLGNLMKQAQKMQEELQKAQARLAEEEVTGIAGGGLVKVTLNGRHEARRVEIDPSLMEEDREMLEDLVAAAINDAVQRITERARETMSGFTSGLGLPPELKLPF